jgi:hypothetical protein
MNTSELIAAVAFAVIFLSALFLFIRDYPSDRLFSVVFVVAGGVLLWCSQITTTTTDTDNKLYSSTTI